MANIIHESATQLMKQMQVVQKCNDTEMEVEFKRAEAMSKLAAPIAAFAKAQADMFISTGKLPEHNLIFSDGEKILTDAMIDSKPKKLKSSLLIDEFTKK